MLCEKRANMTDNELIEALNAIGKECFVSYFKYFKDFSLSNEEIARMIERDRGYTLNSCNSRTSKARAILRNNRGKDALQLIIGAERVDFQCRENAKKLLDNLEVEQHPTFFKRGIIEKDSIVTTENIKLPDPPATVYKELAIILGKICHHIHPKISSYIAESNKTFKSQFEEFCHSSCNIESFFYDGSDCVFPGFRRPVNKEKTKGWKNNVFEQDGTILNDNTFPRHVWTFLLSNRAYSGGSSGVWSSNGLDNFELAHIFAHKKDERKLEEKVFKSSVVNAEPYGLFTSASNVVLIPKGFAKPTDHIELVKICFYKRHLDLYGNNLIGLRDFDNSKIPSWYSEIEWIEPILPDDWEARIENLLKYRSDYLRKKYTKNN